LCSFNARRAGFIKHIPSNKTSAMRNTGLITVLCFSVCAVAAATPGSGGNTASSAGGGSGGGSHAAAASPAGVGHAASHDSRFDVEGARAGSAIAAGAAHESGVTVTRETISGRSATVVSYRMLNPITNDQRRHLHRAGFFERVNEVNEFNTLLCRDTGYLLQPNVRDCIRLVNTH
jgi:hypothetical protein